MLEIAFVLGARQNHFFVELVEAIRHELGEMGVASSLRRDGFPLPADGVVPVLVPPHEWFRLTGTRDAVPREWLRRTIFICAEQPGTGHFEDNVELGRDAGAVFDINRQSVREFGRRGVAAHYFQLGYTPIWDRTGGDDERDLDVLFMGCATSRRLEALARYGGVLWKWRPYLLISDNGRPNFRATESFRVDEEKWSLLRRTKVLLNVHQGESPYFEWLRVVQGLANGCALVSEHSLDFAPLEPGRHFLVGRAGSLHFLAQRLLEDPDRRRAMAEEARGFLMSDVPLRSAVLELVAAAGDLAERDAPAHAGRDRIAVTAPEADELFAPRQPAHSTDDPNVSVLKAALKDTRLELLGLRRDMALLAGARNGGAASMLEIDRATPSWAAAQPRVSVLVSLYNYAHRIESALDSVVAGRSRDTELIVVDDASTDDSRTRVRSWMARNPATPTVLLHHPFNRGLPFARNAALGFARGEYSFILDADNEIYPHAIERLVATLDADGGASFAYGMLELFTGDGPLDLLSHFPWEPERLRSGNYIDAMALIRTSVLRTFGGYTTDARLHGWEDYDLWCRMAEQGHRGALVPEIVARYRSSRHSMLSLTNISVTTAISVLAERHPRLFAGVESPL